MYADWGAWFIADGVGAHTEVNASCKGVARMQSSKVGVSVRAKVGARRLDAEDLHCVHSRQVLASVLLIPYHKMRHAIIDVTCLLVHQGFYVFQINM
jgi:hypothetical protein